MRKEGNLPLLRNLIYSLVLFEKIKTTRARAKAIRGLVDKLVNKIKKGTVAARREVLAVLPQKQIFGKLANEIVPKLMGRSSGYTRIIKIGERVGDGASMVLMEWVKSEEKLEAGSDLPAEASAQAGKPEPKTKKRKVGRGDQANKAK